MAIGSNPQSTHQGPMLVVLAGILMVNLTALCVIVGFREMQSADSSAVAPIQTTTVVAQAQPRPEASAVSQPMPRAQTTQAPETRKASEPETTVEVQNTGTSPAASTRTLINPQPEPSNAKTAPPRDEQPLTFFGMPVE